MRIAHITLYPPRGEKHVSSSGVASYSKNLLSEITADASAEQFVLCDMIKGKFEEYEDEGVGVIRCFSRTPRFVWQLHRQLRHIRPDVIHIQQETALFGGFLTAYLLQWLVALWSRKTIITLHGVLSFTEVTPDFIRKNNYSMPVWLVKLGLKVIYKPLTFWARTVIVHEPAFKETLVKEYGTPSSKVIVIPHGIEDFQTIDQAVARTQLQLKQQDDIVLFMGYASGYKGIDLLIEGFARYAEQNKSAFLIVGAGMNPKLKNDASYQRIYEGYKRKIAQLIPEHQYRWVGFIPEHDITTYFSAADLSVYPYTTALASSGPMSIAIGHEQPFLASDSFAGVFDERILFSKTAEGMAAKLRAFFTNRSAVVDYSKKLKSQRVWRKVGATTLEAYRSVYVLKKGVVEIE